MKAKSRDAQPAAEPIVKIGLVTSASILRATGKSWAEWIALLDRIGGRSMEYRELAEVIAKRGKTNVFMKHEVAKGYEIHIGRRLPGQSRSGHYGATITKSLGCGARTAWDRIVSPKGIGLWLDPLFPPTIAPREHFETRDAYFGEFRTVNPARKIRMTWKTADWEKHTVVELNVVARPNSRSLLFFTHGLLLDVKTREHHRQRWRDAIAALLAAFPELTGKKVPSPVKKPAKRA